ncbi:hypothetical protein SISSUDRAFT_1071671 [Sistotremastrum suecicum HHB10207 ss-3]|uniref:Actin-like ATPase domain-containing protein n=1 Tax=Sistotremastrum suecicum HHB10207 ss-3 TaxID=1314776 RepID=A0A166B3M9_9AGAM|nr:hypothetical protein SISSUDRAFT_1071671 [Sistotremastrum suecicum HHB10207 ss-3]
MLKPSQSSLKLPATHFLGLELGVDQLRAAVLDDHLDLVVSETVDFDADFPEYQTKGGLFTGQDETYTTPVDMWVKGLDLLLDRLRSKTDLSKIRAIGGSAQNASVWWTSESLSQLENLNPARTLHDQLGTLRTFSVLNTPAVGPASAQDTSSHAHVLENALGGPEEMASRVGVSAHQSLFAVQIMQCRERNGVAHRIRTGRISTAASFLCSLFIRKWAPINASQACISGMWNHAANNWDDAALGVVAGEYDDVKGLREHLGAVTTDVEAGIISPYFVERYRFDKGTTIMTFTSDSISTYLSFCPQPSDAVLSFGTTDLLMTPTSSYIPSRAYTLVSHPAQHPSEKQRRYVSIVTSRNADAPRGLVRDMYTKSWSAFDRLVAVVPPGGSIGLDNKLFSFWFLQSESPRLSHVRGLFRFETGVKVNEFRDLRANPRCLVESQLVAFRVAFARMVAVDLFAPTFSSPPVSSSSSRITRDLGFDPYDSRHLPRRVIATGFAAEFPSIMNTLCEVFNATVYVPHTQITSGGGIGLADGENAPNSPKPTGVSRAAIGGAYTAWWWTRTKTGGASDGVGTLEDEVRGVLGRKTIGKGSAVGVGLGVGIGTPNPSGVIQRPRGSSLAVHIFNEADEDSLHVDDHLRRYVGSPGGGSNFSTPSLLGPGISPSTAFTTPDANLGPSSSPSSSSSPAVLPLYNAEGEYEIDGGLVKIAEPDEDAFAQYAATVPEWVRLENMIARGIV